MGGNAHNASSLANYINVNKTRSTLHPIIKLLIPIPGSDEMLKTGSYGQPSLLEKRKNETVSKY